MKFACGHLLFLFLFFFYKKSFDDQTIQNLLFHIVLFLHSRLIDKGGVFGVTVVGDFIICLRPKVLPNSRYFLFQIFYILFASSIMLLFSSPNIGPFWYKFVIRYPSIFHSSLNILSEFQLSVMTVFLKSLFNLEVYKQFQL